MISPGARADALVAELGITSPHELDIEAIAYDSNVDVVYEPMSGCEASLVGYRDRAIATINPSGVRGRERFSVAHELGHWHLHRGRSFQCRGDDQSTNLSSTKSLEKEADNFAAHLLLPTPIFRPVAVQLKTPTFKQLGDVATEFETSLVATALRLAGVNTIPVIVACYNQNGKRWSFPAADIPNRWFLKRALDEESFAHDLLYSGKECASLRKQPAEVWFENSDADNYEVQEQCVNSGGTVLVLLYLEPDMLNAGYDRDVGSRRYNEHGSYIPKQGAVRK